MKEAGETVFMVQTICLRVLILNIIWLISQILTVKSTTGSYKMGKTGKRRKIGKSYFITIWNIRFFHFKSGKIKTPLILSGVFKAYNQDINYSVLPLKAASYLLLISFQLITFHIALK